MELIVQFLHYEYLVESWKCLYTKHSLLTTNLHEQWAYRFVQFSDFAKNWHLWTPIIVNISVAPTLNPIRFDIRRIFLKCSNTQSTEKRSASLHWYLIASYIYIYIILTMDIKWHVYGTRSTMSMYILHYPNKCWFYISKTCFCLIIHCFCDLLTSLRKSSCAIIATYNVLKLINVQVV